MAAVSVAALNLYPVKSCRGIASDRLRVETTGFALNGTRDREWMVVDPRGRFVTQREFPKLARIEPAVDRERLVLRVPGFDAIMPHATAASRPVVVWSAHVAGFDGGDEIAHALSSYLDAELRLVRFDDAKPRPCNPDYVGGTGARTLYSDGYPVLVIGEASLDDLNRRLHEHGASEVPMNRFRPNLVLAGLDAYDEDHIASVTLGDVVLKPVKPCTRCEVTTTDQDTTRRGIEPLRTLSTYRRDDRLAGVTFGMNAIVVAGAGSSIETGAPASVTFNF
jgi:uncharacterized protein